MIGEAAHQRSHSPGVPGLCRALLVQAVRGRCQPAAGSALPCREAEAEKSQLQAGNSLALQGRLQLAAIGVFGGSRLCQCALLFRVWCFALAE